MSAADEDWMPLPRFWDLVERCRSDDEEERYANFVRELSRLPPDQILAFELRLNQLLGESYRADLWAAGYCLCGGCSDDGFDYFRCWLIAQGKEVYQGALANPDSLADFEGDEEEFEFEMLYSAPGTAWQQVTGKTDADWYEAREALKTPPFPELQQGDGGWDPEDETEMRRRLPRLSQRLFDDED